MAVEYTDTEVFRGVTFRRADLTGATFRDCDLTRARIVSSVVTDLRVDGFGGASGRVVVDDVDVTAFVAAELDRRHPERVQLRAVRTADEHRAMWDTVERLWSETLARAERLPEATRFERVEDEWSFVETLRHLVFAVDVWVGRMVLGEPTPYSRIGLPPTDYPSAGTPELGIDLDAQPSYAEVVAVHADRRAQVRGVLEALTDTELDQVRTAVPAPAWGEESHSVGICLRVVLNEHCAHHRYAVRDLAVLERRQAVGSTWNRVTPASG
jgi:hypothetical protein